MEAMSERPNLSRRAIMSVAAALPAVAVLPAVTAAAAVANLDAELIALGKQFELLENQYDLAAARGDQAEPHCDDITDAMEAPMRRIMALPATTLAGLAVKARVARFACFDFYEKRTRARG